MVFATGQTHSVEEFLIECLDILKIKYKKKIDKGITFFIDKSNNKLICKTNKRYYRPNEVHYLKGNAKLAKKVLKWKPKFTFKSLVKEMINSEFGKRN